MAHRIIDALGVKVTAVSPEAIFSHVEQYLESPRFHQITTVNPDFIMTARKNQGFKDVINASDLALADGVGIYLPALLQGIKLPGRIPGADLAEYLLGLAEKKNISVFLCARADGLSSAEETKQALLQKFPKLHVKGLDINVHSPEALDQALEQVSGHIVLANFGAPIQDTFLARLRHQDKGIRLAMGVGGTFDYFTGKQKRAPQLLRTIGLEWLWRLMLQPLRRGKRTFNYVVIYSFLCLTEALLQTFRVRRAMLSRHIAKVSIFFGIVDQID